jgi:hypothetical protein
VEQVEQVFDELESTVSGNCAGCGVSVFPAPSEVRHESGCPLYQEPEPAAEIDDDSPRQQAVQQNGNDGAVYDDPWFGAPKWAKYKAQDASGRWFWYENKPAKSSSMESWLRAEGAAKIIYPSGEPNPNWRDTLIERP